MGVDVAVTTVIERPIADVAAYAGDPTKAPEWCRRVDVAEWETEPPVRLGSRLRFRVTFAGRAVESTAEVVELTPDEQVAVRSTTGRVPVRTTCTWRPVGARVTHMVLRNECTLPGFTSLASPLLAAMLRRAMQNALDDLKRRLEAAG